MEGDDMSIICPKCGDTNEELSVFCKSCSFALSKTRRDFKATVRAPINKSLRRLSTKPQKLKICPQCHGANDLNQRYCSECSSPLPESCIQELVIDIEAECRKESEKENKKRVIIGLGGTIWLLGVTITAMIFGGSLDIILLGDFVIIFSVLNLLFPEELFRLSHLFSIKEVELTDIYYVLNTIGSVLTIVIMSVLMLMGLFMK